MLEVIIALFVRDSVVRPYLGDSLAVVLLYCGLRTLTVPGYRPAVALALAAACAVELGQWFHYVDRLGLGDYRVARIVLGIGFDPHDFLAYVAGAAAIWLVEAWRHRAS